MLKDEKRGRMHTPGKDWKFLVLAIVLLTEKSHGT